MPEHGDLDNIHGIAHREAYGIVKLANVETFLQMEDDMLGRFWPTLFLCDIAFSLIALYFNKSFIWALHNDKASLKLLKAEHFSFTS